MYTCSAAHGVLLARGCDRSAPVTERERAESRDTFVDLLRVLLLSITFVLSLFEDAARTNIDRGVNYDARFAQGFDLDRKVNSCRCPEEKNNYVRVGVQVPPPSCVEEGAR